MLFHHKKLAGFDWAIFQEKFHSESNFTVLEGFLSELLLTEIAIIEVLKRESSQHPADDKYNCIDVKVTDSHQQIILIEIRYLREMDFLKRILFPCSKIVGADYSDVSKVIFLDILYFDFGKGDDYIYHAIPPFNAIPQFIGIHSFCRLQLNENQKRLHKLGKVADVYPEYYLIKPFSFGDTIECALDEWIYFFKHNEIKEEFTGKGLKQAKKMLTLSELSSEEYWDYDRYQSKLHYDASMYESTYVLGKMEGEKEKLADNLEIAKSMLAEGFDIKTIVKMTGLTEEMILR
jgi:predicted transposase/invertase (TIGR01784 family)